MIVLDTNVLVYAVGAEHPLRAPSRRLFDAIEGGRVQATTTVEVIQEFLHVRAQRRARGDATRVADAFRRALTPLLSPGEGELQAALRLFERHERLRAFDALLAAVAISQDAEALVSADAAFAGIRGLRHVSPGSPAFERLLA